MAAENQSRRTAVEISFDGTDITEDIRPYLRSVTYTDNEEDTADDLQIRLQDREGLWLTGWLNEAVQAAAAAKLKIRAAFVRQNWTGNGETVKLPCGDFELDSVQAGGPPSEVTLKATSLGFSAPVRQTKRSKAWESYDLAGIAREIARANGRKLLYESASKPFYKRAEQTKSSDIAFLSRLCQDAGLSLKCTDSQLVIFDQAAYEAKPPVLAIKRGKAGGYTKYSLSSGAADTQYASCRVRYRDPATGKLIEGTAEAAGADAESGQCLEVWAKVSGASEAKALAAKRLRLHNKFTRTASFTFPGNPALAAGVTVLLEDWGGWSGKYLVRQAKHTVDAAGGYTTQISCRRVLEGY